MKIVCQPSSGSFSFVGKYRVQSVQQMMQSALTGVWVEPKTLNCLNAQDVTRFARMHPACLDSNVEISLIPAFVSKRAGAFASSEDALYYLDNFEAAIGSDTLYADILDVPKLLKLWRDRRIVLEALVHPDPQTTNLLESDITPVAIDEYMCHEAGHLLGVSIQQKLRNGYFRLGGRFRWPLVYIEEFRADINAWDLALTHLDTERARRVITYTLLHRLGLAARNLWQGQPGAGFVPFLDFSIAWRAGLIDVEPNASFPLRFDTSADALNRLHREVLSVSRRLTLADRLQPELWDVAQRSMSWLDESLRDDQAVSHFRDALSPAKRVSRRWMTPERRSF